MRGPTRFRQFTTLKPHNLSDERVNANLLVVCHQKPASSGMIWLGLAVVSTTKGFPNEYEAII